MSAPPTTKPKLAVWKFASCDGCQLTLLDCEDELLALSEAVEISHFLELSDTITAGPYDLSLVEGSITTAADRDRIRAVRAQSRFLVTIGACATAGGIQALRNFADIDDFLSVVYARPEYIDTLATSTAISAHVPVDFELRGCPIDRRQLLEVITAYLAGRRPNIPRHQRVHRVQAARTDVCDGRRRHTVPRPGDPLRVRRAVPVGLPRVLRLLRSHHRPESRRDERVAAHVRDERGRHRPHLRHVQRSGLRIRRARPWRPGIGN